MNELVEPIGHLLLIGAVPVSLAFFATRSARLMDALERLLPAPTDHRGDHLR